MATELTVKSYFCANCEYTCSANENTSPYSAYYVKKWNVKPGQCAQCAMRGVESIMALDITNAIKVTLADDATLESKVVTETNLMGEEITREATTNEINQAKEQRDKDFDAVNQLVVSEKEVVEG